MNYRFTTVFIPEKDEPDAYTVRVPALPEIVTFGESIAEARFMAQDAIELVITSMLELGELIPTDVKPKRTSKGSIVEEVMVSVSHSVIASSSKPYDHGSVAFAS